MSKLKFNWKNYVGTGLKVFWLDGKYKFKYLDTEKQSNIVCQSARDLLYIRDDRCKPIVRNPRSLSYDNWLWIMHGDHNHSIERRNGYIILHDLKHKKNLNAFSLNTGKFIDSQLVSEDFFERMRELHTAPNFDELLKAELIIEAEEGDYNGN